MKYWVVATICAITTCYAQTVVRVSGRIQSQGNQPLKGEVLVVTGDGAVRLGRVSTDDEGVFTIDTGPGRMILVASAEGYASEERALMVGRGQRSAPVVFVLSPVGSVSGRVFDESGRGVAGARVWVGYRGETRRWQVGDEIGGQITDSSGLFSIPAVAQGRPFVLHAEADGWLVSSSDALVLRAPEITGVMLLLGRHGATVRGRVVDGTGDAIEGAAVALRVVPVEGGFTREQRDSPAFAHNTNRVAMSAGDGSFEFAGVPAGRVVITARSGSRRAAAIGAAADGRQTEIVLTLH